MYRSNFATMIDDAINECITFGSGCVRRGDLDIEAQWSEDGEEIEVTIFNNGAVMYSHSEKVAI